MRNRALDQKTQRTEGSREVGGWRNIIFIDTTFWVGDADSNDELHASSHAVIEQLRLGKTPLALTTDFVLDETVTILGKRKGFGAENAVTVALSLISSPRVFVVYVDEGLLRGALNLYPTYRGKLSLTDVASVVVMEKYGVKEIFSHDLDFNGVRGVRRRETA